MPDDSTRTVLVALGAGLAVALAKVGAAVITGSPAMAAEASHSLADTANDLFLFIAQRRSAHDPDSRHPLGYGREAYFWALIAALGVFVAGAAFSLRDGIIELIHPGVTSSFTPAYVVLAVSAVSDLLSFRQSAGQMAVRGRRYSRGLIDESKVTSDPTLAGSTASSCAGPGGRPMARTWGVSIFRVSGMPYFLTGRPAGHRPRHRPDRSSPP